MESMLVFYRVPKETVSNRLGIAFTQEAKGDLTGHLEVQYGQASYENTTVTIRLADFPIAAPVLSAALGKEVAGALGTRATLEASDQAVRIARKALDSVLKGLEL